MRQEAATKADEVSLKVPKLRRSAFEITIAQRYQDGRSASKKFWWRCPWQECRFAGWRTESLWGSRISAGTISEFNKKAYVHIDKWRMRPSKGKHPYVYLDGFSLKRNWGGEYEKVAVLVEIAVNEYGRREVIGSAEGMKEDNTSWSALLKSLKKRSLEDAKLFIGDKCLGFLEKSTNATPTPSSNTVRSISIAMSSP